MLQRQVPAGPDRLGASFDPCPGDGDAVTGRWLLALQQRREGVSSAAGRAHYREREVIQRVLFTLKDAAFDRQPPAPVKQAAAELCSYCQVGDLAC